MEKIIIFTSLGGGGQQSVTKALQGYLKNNYLIQPSLIFTSILAPLDLAQRFSSNNTNGEDLYNYFLSNKWFKILAKIFAPLGYFYYRARTAKVKALVQKFLEKEKPNLVISVIPFLNNALLHVCKELNIPFIVLSCDLDPGMYLRGMHSPTYKKFMLAVPFADTIVTKRTNKHAIKKSLVTVTGYPLRQEFYEKKNTHEIKQSLNIKPHLPIILVMMGSRGGPNLVTVAKKLATLSHSAHLILCAGKNEEIKKQLDKISFPNHITTTIIGFTYRISDLMAISDIFISKSGSASFAESLYMQIPLILDHTRYVLDWEQANHQFLEKHRLGVSVHNYKQILDTINKWLNNTKELKTIKKNLTKLDLVDGCVDIKKLIVALLNKPFFNIF